MNLNIYKGFKVKRFLAWNVFAVLFANCSAVLAKGSNTTIGTVASNITGTLTSVTNVVTATSYVAGLGFMIGAIMKFKAHKENPQQVTLGTCFTLLLVAAALLFMPSILDVAGFTLFGTSGGTVAGPTGTVYE